MRRYRGEGRGGKSCINPLVTAALGRIGHRGINGGLDNRSISSFHKTVAGIPDSDLSSLRSCLKDHNRGGNHSCKTPKKKLLQNYFSSTRSCLTESGQPETLSPWEAPMQNGKNIEIFKLQAIIYHLSAGNAKRIENSATIIYHLSAGIKDQNRGVSNLASFLCQPRAIQNFFG